MNISQIAAFQAVMTSASLSDAAKKLGRTQPAVSAAIKTLEDQLGLQLFSRTGRKLEPVPEAHYLLTETDAILSRLSRVRQTMRSLVDAQSGRLNVAAMPGPVAMLFPRFVASQIAGDGQIDVSLFARSSAQIAELARAQSIDFGFADAPEPDEVENLYQAEIITGDCCVALPSDHRLATQDSVSFADLEGVPLGGLQATHALQIELREAFNARGLGLRTMIESQTFLPILQFVLAGQCCSILDPLTVAHVNHSTPAVAGITMRPLSEPLRYRYAIIAPRFRPVSLLADKIREAWRAEVVQLLDGVGARPALEGVDQLRADSSAP